ncbi:MAG: hypothetical protein K2M16_09095 [Muribaculaceae bacterium]|nr:hypothetical protein [Muribaculaceae bacterium]
MTTLHIGVSQALLNSHGSVSYQEAMEKAEEEYRKFQVRELSPVERAYLDTIKALNAKAKTKGKIQQFKD